MTAPIENASWFLPFTPLEFQAELDKALRRMWSTKAVKRRGGNHLHLLTQLVIRCLSQVQERGGSVRVNPDLQGWYRDHKRWDLAVLNARGEVVAALELKSLLTAFYKNLNNRLEEALGSSADFETLRERCFAGQRRVWTAYVLILADSSEARRVRKAPKLIAPVASRDFEFLDGIGAAELACRRLVTTKRYDRAAPVVSRKPTRKGTPVVDKDGADTLASLLNALLVHSIGALDS